ncbi:hypothetical protein HN51_033992 [Arachis hypogaea]|uniref:Uncharacterized protein n=1 Tax=Arachis hypogaea TaxID=3818 RepID=A0A445A9S7_ARAHY|nr:hypothetical protein Ahy_B03g068460 isoform D [Arachis hypogaea]
MSNNVGKRGLAEQNHKFFDNKRLNNGVVNGELGSGSSNDDNTRFNRQTRDGNNGLRGQIQVHDSMQISQQPPQGPVICWERFLPIRSIKVLLVEDDDSIQHAMLSELFYEIVVMKSLLFPMVFKHGKS